MLHLDIQQPGVRSVEDALDVLTLSEHLSGGRAPLRLSATFCTWGAGASGAGARGAGMN
jgi:hypothetical protein